MLLVLPAPFSPVIAVEPRPKSNTEEVWDLMFSSSTLVICINAYLDIKLNICKEKKLLKTKTKHGRMLFMKIETGESVILVLHTPREKLLGILDEVSPAGVSIRAIDLSYFDDWWAALPRIIERRRHRRCPTSSSRGPDIA